MGHLLAAAGSYAVLERVSVFSELALQLVPSQGRHELFATVGAAHAVTPSFVRDAGLRRKALNMAKVDLLFTGVKTRYKSSEPGAAAGVTAAAWTARGATWRALAFSHAAPSRSAQ